MLMKKKAVETSVTRTRKAFNYRPDDIRTRQLLELMRKKGVRQQGIVSMAISEMHEKEFPAIPRKQ